MALLALGALGISACAEGVGPDGALEQDQEQNQPGPVTVLTQQDREQILEIAEESGFFAEDFGSDDINAGTAASANLAAVGEEDGGEGEVGPTPLWVRLRGRPVRMDVTVEMDEESGLAIATKEVEFDKEFLLDNTDDYTLNPTSKPLQELLLHQAAFEELEEPIVDAKGRERHWRLVSIAPARFIMTDAEKRTVQIGSVTVAVNGEVVLELLHDSEALPPLLDLDGGVPMLQVGDEVTVTAAVSNDQEDMRSAFVFLHFFEGSRKRGMWHRVLMEQSQLETGEVSYSYTYTVEEPYAHGRIVVDAIDSQTFMTESDDDYRANTWGIPHTVAAPVDDDGDGGGST